MTKHIPVCKNTTGNCGQDAEEESPASEGETETVGKPTGKAPDCQGMPHFPLPLSSFHPTPRSELRSTPLFKLELRSAPISELHSALKSELCSTFTSEVTADVK